MHPIAPNAPDSYFFTEDDLPLSETQHVFTQSTVWKQFGMDDAVITTDTVVRSMPKNRNFLIFAGLEEIISNALNWKFTDKHIAYLLKHALIGQNLVDDLKNFRFTGDIYAMPEGTIFFPGETVIRVTAPIIEANMITDLQMNGVSSNTIFASKLVRSRIAARGKSVLTAALRPQAYESGSKGTRASVLLRMSPLTLPFFNYKYRYTVDSKFLTHAQHLFIKSFPDELSAMRAMASVFPARCGLMVDTYDFERGMENAIIVGKELMAKGERLQYIFVDSKPLLERSRYARKRLDEEGMQDVIVCVGSNLEEFQIAELERAGAPVEIYCTVTESINVTDDPKLEVVVKMAQMQHKGVTRDTAKLAPGKESYPGVKQVFRQFDANGKMVKDVVGLNDEDFGIPLLQPIVKNGELVVDMPSFKQIQEYVDQQIEQLPDELKDIHADHPYPVEVSPKLEQLFQDVKNIYQP